MLQKPKTLLPFNWKEWEMKSVHFMMYNSNVYLLLQKYRQDCISSGECCPSFLKTIEEWIFWGISGESKILKLLPYCLLEHKMFLVRAESSSQRLPCRSRWMISVAGACVEIPKPGCSFASVQRYQHLEAELDLSQLGKGNFLRCQNREEKLPGWQQSTLIRVCLCSLSPRCGLAEGFFIFFCLAEGVGAGRAVYIAFITDSALSGMLDYRTFWGPFQHEQSYIPIKKKKKSLDDPAWEPLASPWHSSFCRCGH